MRGVAKAKIFLAALVLSGCASMENCWAPEGSTLPPCAQIVTIDGKQYVDRSGCRHCHREPRFREPRVRE